MEVRPFEPNGPIKGDDGERNENVLHRWVEEESGPEVTVKSDPKGATEEIPNFQDGDTVVRDKVANVVRITTANKARKPEWGRATLNHFDARTSESDVSSEGIKCHLNLVVPERRRDKRGQELGISLKIGDLGRRRKRT
jgi:hypothetical protein